MFEVIISLPSCLYNHLTEAAAPRSSELWHKQRNVSNKSFLRPGGGTRRHTYMTMFETLSSELRRIDPRSQTGGRRRFMTCCVNKIRKKCTCPQPKKNRPWSGTESSVRVFVFTSVSIYNFHLKVSFSADHDQNPSHGKHEKFLDWIISPVACCHSDGLSQNYTIFTSWERCSYIHFGDMMFRQQIFFQAEHRGLEWNSSSTSILTT